MANQPAFATVYDLAFQVSPIILVDGIASTTLGGMLPIIALVGQSAAFLQGAASDGFSTSDFFARFVPVPGSTLVNQQIATYPFANQQTAANATIQQPLNISLRMIAPVKDTAGYLTKTAIFTSLQNSLVAHNAAGGTYHIATPAYIYKNAILTSMTDTTGGAGKQQQIEYQLDFVQPLVTGQQATAALNSLMSKLSSGASVSGATPAAGSSFWSNAAVAVGSSAQNAVSNVTGIAGVVNTYLSSAL
ncbi:hypothetical protein BGLT_02263 [Caballeronia glathei]|uniref:Uncharacterized protein n=1 Tax=Caballeronia glathei TaxID=60547 RepID=A0A069PLQ0_9BURK|nr:hypothetical protein [Caballeronia glathei]KDR41540.1 hypothetical protein BG61_16720 [Caballeronia glathei]CDY79482.1 hypothetical protein BGLT_02263 [Caballeronia glathei]